MPSEEVRLEPWGFEGSNSPRSGPLLKTRASHKESHRIDHPPQDLDLFGFRQFRIWTELLEPNLSIFQVAKTSETCIMLFYILLYRTIYNIIYIYNQA